MSNHTIQILSRVTLDLTVEDAAYLKGLLQNPPNGIDLKQEDPILSKMRTKLFNIFNEAYQYTCQNI